MATVGNKIVPNDLNSLFAKLETVRKQQLNSNHDLTTAQRNALSTAFTTTVATSGGKAQSSQVQQLKNNVSTLTNSYNVSSNFVSSITVPSVGSLLKAADMNTITNVIDNVAKACQNCTNNSTNGTNFQFNSTNSTNGTNFQFNSTNSTENTNSTNGTNFYIVFFFQSGFRNKCGGNPQSQYLYDIGLIK